VLIVSNYYNTHGRHGKINSYLRYIFAVSEIKLVRVNLVFRNFTIIVHMHRSNLQIRSERSEHLNTTAHQAEATHTKHKYLKLGAMLLQDLDQIMILVMHRIRQWLPVVASRNTQVMQKFITKRTCTKDIISNPCAP
jgi:hypothetical protein